MEFEKPHRGSKLGDHVTAKRNLEICELSFVLDGTHRTHSVDDEAIPFGFVLESLFATPLEVTEFKKPLRKETNVETHRSCCDGETRDVSLKNYAVSVTALTSAIRPWLPQRSIRSRPNHE